MQFGAHLPIAQFGALAPWSPAWLNDYTAQAVDLGFTYIAVSDHLAHRGRIAAASDSCQANHATSQVMSHAQ
jgi:hypothetical protein